MTVETWPGPMNASRRMSGESRIARIAGMMVTWLQKTEKLWMPSALARISVSAVEGAVVSKPMAKNMTCLSGLASGQLQRVRGRIDDAHVHAARLVLERAAVASRERASCRRKRRRLRPARCAIARPSSIRPIGKHAYRAAGAVDQFDVRRQQILQAEAIDRVRVSAADFHDAVVAVGIGQPADLFRRPGDHFGFAKLVYESHAISLHLRRRIALGIVRARPAVALHFLHGRLASPSMREHPHLLERVLFADLAHGEAHVDQHPVAGSGLSSCSSPRSTLAAHADHFDQRRHGIVGRDFDDLSRYGEAHGHPPVSWSPSSFQFMPLCIASIPCFRRATIVRNVTLYLRPSACIAPPATDTS